MKSVVIGLLCYNAQAIKRPHSNQLLEYRPYVTGRTPWYKTVPEKEPDYPYNYKVPNLGVDRDIEATLNHAASSETRLGHKFNHERYEANFVKPWQPEEYTVPNFGIDKDVSITQKNMSAAEKSLEHKWKDADALAKPAVIPRNYHVPNFGQDREVTGDFDNLAIVEKRFNHKLSLADVEKKPKIPIVPDYGMDHEIKTSLKNLADTEKKLKVRFTPEFVQTFIELNMGQPEEGEDDDSLVQTESDPICHSAGCTQYKAPDAKKHPMNYFVPDFGMDVDIIDSFQSQKQAETALKAEVKAAPKEKKASLAQLDFGIDNDILTVQNSIKEAEQEAGSSVDMGRLSEYI